MRHTRLAAARPSDTALLRFRTLVPLLVAVCACSSTRRALFDDVGTGAGGAASAAAGAPQGPGSLGGYGFVDDLDAVAGSGGANAGWDAGALNPYVLPPSVYIGDAGVVSCGTAPCACNNGIDDDSDGKIDGFDEECTGAIDDDEGSFSTGIPGDNSDPKWQDCFFDGNSGAGDDHCRYHADCLTGAKSASDPDCAVSAQCRDFCAARTPNGCDCFGCCTVQLDDESRVSVFIGESCSLEDVADPERCQRCEPSLACGNTCGECELCPGKSIEDLPASCSTGGGGGGGEGGSGSGSAGSSSLEPAVPYSCDSGRPPCSSTSACPGGQYCSLGCCLDVVIY